MRILVDLARRLRARATDEHGAVLVIVAGCMVMFLAAGAYAIDLGSGRQAETKAQSAADAASEAAADAIETGASATTAADTIAVANGFPASQVSVTYPYNGSSSQVQVIVNSSAITELARSKGINSLPVKASSVAAVNTTVTTTTGTTTNTYTTTVTSPTSQTVTSTSTGTVTSTTCPTVGNGCLAVFASGTSCSADSGDSNDPIVFGGGVKVSGGAWSDGSIDLGGGGSTFSTLTYASGCSISPNGGNSPPSYQQNSNTFNNGYPVAASPITSWPINYAPDFPDCSGSGCTGPSGTPSWCTQASTSSSWSINTYNPATLATNQIYCAVGGGTPAQPSTWTGALTVAGGGTGSSAINSSYVAGSITVGGGTQLSACGYTSSGYSSSTCSGRAPSTFNYPLFYATNGAVNDANGGTSLTGDWFAPNGGITVGGGTSFVGFLEAETVNMSAGGISGDGPPDSGSQLGTTSTTTSTSTSVSTGSTTSLSSSTATTVTSGSSTSTNGSKLVS